MDAFAIDGMGNQDKKECRSDVRQMDLLTMIDMSHRKEVINAAAINGIHV